MKVKKINYKSPIKENFQIKKLYGKRVLFDEGKEFEGKLELQYDNGNIHSEGEIKRGLKIGEWKTYYKTGELKIKENFLSGLR